MAVYLMKPPGWPAHLLFVGMALWTCWYARLPIQTLGFLLIFMGWAAVLALWGLWAVIRIGLWLHWRRQAIPARWRRWVVGPLVLLATAGLFQSGMIARFAFKRSRPQFEQIARQALAWPAFRWTGPKRVGAFEVQSVDLQEVTPGEPEVYFHLTEYGTAGGFVYRPNRRTRGATTDRDMGDGWYAWYHWPT